MWVLCFATFSQENPPDPLSFLSPIILVKFWTEHKMTGEILPIFFINSNSCMNSCLLLKLFCFFSGSILGQDGYDQKRRYIVSVTQQGAFGIINFTKHLTFVNYIVNFALWFEKYNFGEIILLLSTANKSWRYERKSTMFFGWSVIQKEFPSNFSNIWRIQMAFMK